MPPAISVSKLPAMKRPQKSNFRCYRLLNITDKIVLALTTVTALKGVHNAVFIDQVVQSIFKFSYNWCKFCLIPTPLFLMVFKVRIFCNIHIYELTPLFLGVFKVRIFFNIYIFVLSLLFLEVFKVRLFFNIDISDLKPPFLGVLKFILFLNTVLS